MIGDPAPQINQIWHYNSRFVQHIQVYRIVKITNGLVYMAGGTFYNKEVFTGVGNNWRFSKIYYPTRFEMLLDAN